MSVTTESSPLSSSAAPYPSRPRSLSVLCVNRPTSKKMESQSPNTAERQGPQQTPQGVAPANTRGQPQGHTPATPLGTPGGGPVPPRKDHYLAQLLPGITEWPHNDEALTEALKLRQAQEQTKQEFYRLENRKRTLEILTMATHAGVPGHAIASIFEANPKLPNAAAAIAERAGASRAAAVASASAAASAVGSKGHPELVNYEDAQQRSPTRFRPTHARSASSIPAFSARPATQAYYPRQIAPQQGPQGAMAQIPPMGQGMAQGTGVYQGTSPIQFHHWKPNQLSEDKRKMERSPKQIKPESSPEPERRNSQVAPTAAQQRVVPPSPAGPAAVAAAHQRRRSGHVRHRSEANIPSARNSWYTSRGTEEGASILASMAQERTKHDVGFILASEKAQNGNKLTQMSPGPHNRTLLPPHQLEHPGPIAAQGPQQGYAQHQSQNPPTAGPKVRE